MKQAIYRLAYSIIVLLCAFPAINAAGTKKVSVYVDGDITKAQKAIVASAVMSRLSISKDYVPFERNETFLKALMNEQDYQLSGDVADAQIRKIGNRFGVDYVIAIIVAADETRIFFNARLIELESGRVMKSVNTDREYNGISSIKGGANNVAYRLINKQSK